MSKGKKNADKNAKKAWQPEEVRTLSPFQKFLIAAILSFVPFFFGIALPLLARDHYVKMLKIPAELFLGAPEKINLVNTGEVGATYKVDIHGFEFKIPEKYTPSRINDFSAEFRAEPRREARYIYALAEPHPRSINFSATGIARWFIPSEMSRFLPLILHASWHPIRLMFKAQFFSSEGLSSKVFEANWDLNHRAYIFPTPGEKGYLGRGFSIDHTSYFEFLLVDTVHPVTLREWVNLAMKIKPPDLSQKPDGKQNTPAPSLETLIEHAQHPNRENRAISESLSMFYRTQSPEWLIPVAMVMQNREFYPDLIDLHKQYLSRFPVDSPHKTVWNEVLDNAVAKIIKMEIDPQPGLRELNVYCKNLTNLDIGQVWARIDIKNESGEKSFMAPVLSQGRLFSNDEKHMYVKAPDDINLGPNPEISYRIMQIDFLR